MKRDASKHWVHPQTVPRGFLRMYILNLLAKSPESGYSIIQRIEESTDGAWRPGPGTMYPLLRSLAEEGVVRVRAPGRKSRLRTYVLTPEGKQDLDAMKSQIAGVGKKERVMISLLSELLPGESFVDLVTNRFKEGADAFRRKAMEVPSPRREMALRQFRLLLEDQMQWIDSQLGSAGGKPAAGA